ncbi:hypothetical protein HYC85_010168 [Camellia sinensis]|uniref:Uncharacterized protein n=1 Tax=Camellia sinensis TaxID=4442 RepID=A0A7J7HJS3_CAMSI|nr:hypothetical protein HYC85_010168 [Camellia sinensis]
MDDMDLDTCCESKEGCNVNDGFVDMGNGKHSERGQEENHGNGANERSSVNTGKAR